MICRSIAAATLLSLCATVLQAQEEPAQEPTDVGLEERAASQLAQIDITVSGSPQAVAGLTPDDLRIKVHFKNIREFRLDRLCGPVLDDTRPSLPADALSLESRTSYLFFFDQTHLTMPGRMRGLELARELVSNLITGANRAMIVSNAGRLEIVEPFTSDPQRLLAGLDRLQGDRQQWDTYANEEDGRIQDVIQTLNERDRVEQAIGLARRYQKDERWRAMKSLRRLSHTLSQLVDVGYPKAVFYFADTMRSNAGEHYTRFFGAALSDSQPLLDMMVGDAAMASLPFDEVVNNASAQGIRFYTIRPLGLPGLSPSLQATGRGLTRTQGGSGTSGARHDHAAQTLNSLAGETGGHAFLAGEKSSRIADRVRADFSCLFLVSFDPGGLPLDSPLRVIVELQDRPDLKVHSRGRIVIQSRSAKTTARLLGAFTMPSEDGGGFDVSTNLVPTAFDDGLFSALLQVSVPGSPIPNASWEMGASVIFKDKVRDESSGRVGVNRQSVPVVYEHELDFKPGWHEIVVVAHETSTGLMVSDRLLVEWPDPGRSPASIGPIALLQPTTGAFLRAGESRSSGSLALTGADVVATDRPVALVALVCHNGNRKSGLTVDRRLVGDSPVEFDSLVLDPGGKSCAQVRDIVPAGTLSGGFYRYEIKLSRNDESLHEAGIEFEALPPTGL